ncbi:MAG: DUF4428 domain-containing protein [Oscillospiraceae bacterium]|nr:DUF4428 domain-containing protein [Oscillospiraceae bacterium]
MGLFDKKICSLCGKEIGILGNRKLADGNMCKDCASKLSPYFVGRSRTSVKDIQAQLAYREQNKANLAKFSPTTYIDGTTKVYVDENAKTFIVTRLSNWSKSNPDIINTFQVQSVTYDVDEDKDEIYQTVDGKSVSYDPPQYEYEYEFNVTIKVSSPWFDTIKFEMEQPGSKVESRDSQAYYDLDYKCRLLQHLLMPQVYGVPGLETPSYVSTSSGDLTPEEIAAFQAAELAAAQEESWTCSCGHTNTANFCAFCGKPKPVTNRWFCPQCGKENTGNFCVYCGTKKPDFI